jgi:hypothetical protein
MISVPQYALIKDKICMSYFGNCNEYLIQLKLLRPFMLQKFPGIEIYLSCKDEVFHLLEEKTIKRSDFKKENFAFTYEIKCNMIEHPIEKLMEESEIEILPIKQKRELNKTFSIFPDGVLPTKSLTDNQIKEIKKMAINKGYVEDKNGDWIIGVENEFLFNVGEKKASLIPTGLGTNLFKKMFFDCEILKL